MAKALPKSKDDLPNAETTLAEDILFRGQLRFQEALQINGNFEGRIETTGHLIIGENAHVQADIEAKEVTVAGKLVGNIQSSERVQIFAPGEIYGDIATKDLAMDSGAFFNGVCVMKR